jgi:hypothetical protein
MILLLKFQVIMMRLKDIAATYAPAVPETLEKNPTKCIPHNF